MMGAGEALRQEVDPADPIVPPEHAAHLVGVATPVLSKNSVAPLSVPTTGPGCLGGAHSDQGEAVGPSHP